MSTRSTTVHIPVNRPTTWFVWCVQTLGLAVAYYLTAQIGLLIPSVGSMVSLFWAPIGIAVAVLFRGRLALWPGVFVGAFAANYPFGGPVAAAGIAAGSTAATVLMAYLFKRYRLNPQFESLHDVVVLVGVGFAGTAVSAAVGATWSAATGAFPWARAGYAFLMWWLGDAGGVVIVAPVVLAWSGGLLARYRRKGQLRSVLVNFGQTLAVCGLLFSGYVPNGPWSLPAAFLPFLFIAWTAAVHRAWPATVQVLIIGVFVILSNFRQHGPCVYLDPSIRLYTTWAYLITGSVVALGLSALLAERDYVERKLQAGEETYRALVHDNPALICRFSTDGVLVFVNETFRRAFLLPKIGDPKSFTRTDLRKAKSSHNFFETVGLARDPATLAQLRDLDNPDKPIYFESKVTTPANETRWFRWTARAVDMASSVVVEYHAVGLDVTDQKRAEAERKALEAQAIQTQQYEAIGVLAGGIAHEFNNVLTSVIGNTDLSLLLLPPDNEVRPMLADVLEGAQRAAELTKQLSMFAGQTDTHRGPVNLTEVVRSSQQLITVVVARHSPIRYELAEEGAIAIADESKVRQLLMSIVTNAAEATVDTESRSEIVIRTSTVALGENTAAREWVNGNELTPGEYVQLEVTDTGCGMNTATLARVFEPFFTTKFPGRGLGMAAVLGIVQDHLGAIQVNSQKGRGTTVRVLFPAMNAQVDHPTPIPRGRRTVRVGAADLVRKV
jgi:signal transduction histidine kinase